MSNSNAALARDLLRDQSGFDHQPNSARLATAQALAFVAIAEELARANDIAIAVAIRSGAAGA